MELIIKIIDKNVSLILKDGKKTVQAVEFADAHNLTEKLLPEIDKMLQRRKISPRNLEKVSVKTNLKESYTSARIAKTVAKTINWQLAFDKK